MTDNAEINSADEQPPISEVAGGTHGVPGSLKYSITSTPTLRLDERGRLKLTSDFKTVLEMKYGSGFNAFYITSMDGESAEIYPMPDWLERKARLYAMPQSNKARKILSRRYTLWGDEAPMDPQGRVQIPELLRKQAQLSGDVKVSAEDTLIRVTSLKFLTETVETTELTDEHLNQLEEAGL